ncbi:MAG: hypothetical protein HY089_03060 [Ignavibacteriales bacterium]|nr:hypothetical protein [Ignavibacteriales bacterium]
MTKIKHGLHQNINANKIMISLKNTFLWCIVLFLLLAGGCDKAYRYAFFPPERVEYTLVPDPDLLHLSSDTSYAISRDSLAIVYDRKSYKVEVKYLSDYQLNNFEFSDDSKDGEFSANPFTFAGWVDPQLGYTLLTTLRPSSISIPSYRFLFRIAETCFRGTGAKKNRAATRASRDITGNGKAAAALMMKSSSGAWASSGRRFCILAGRFSREIAARGSWYTTRLMKALKK